MRVLIVLVGIVFLLVGCNKNNQPVLPKSYENISFFDFMNILNLKRTQISNDTVIYESEVLKSDKYKNSDFYDYYNPALNYCKAQGGNLLFAQNFSTNFLSDKIDYSKSSTFYCKKDNDILFTIFKHISQISYQAHPRFVYYFSDSKIFSNEVNNFIFKKEQEELKKSENEARIAKQKIELAENKATMLNKHIELIKNNAYSNSKSDIFTANKFKALEQVYYFSFITQKEQWGEKQIRLMFNDFILFTSKDIVNEKFTNKILNSIETKYRFKVKMFRNSKLISNKIYDDYDVIQDNINLDKVEIIVGLKQINEPTIDKQCNNRELTQLFINQGDKAIKNIRGADCVQVYSYKASLYNIIIYDYEKKRVVFYAENPTL